MEAKLVVARISNGVILSDDAALSDDNPNDGIGSDVISVKRSPDWFFDAVM